MCNTTIAKSKLLKIKNRTQKDIYKLSYESTPITPLNIDTFNKVKKITNHDNLECPLRLYFKGVDFNSDFDVFFNVLHHLAYRYSIVFDISEMNS